VLLLGAIGLAIAIMVLAVLVGCRYATSAKSHAANDDDNASIISDTTQTPLLRDSEVLDLESNGNGMGIDLDADGPEYGLQLQPLPGQPNHLAHAWQSSDMQLVVLDHELRVVLWSRGMAKVMSSFRPALGTSVEGLPFSSTDARQRVASTLDSVIRERGVVGEAAALQAIVTTAPNVTLHLVPPLSTGAHKAVLLSMTAIKMKSLSAASSTQGLDNEPCHLLIMGKESLDPILAGLSHDNIEVASASSTVSDLTSEGGTAGDLTTSTSTGTSTKSSSSSSDGPGAAGGLQSRRRRLDGSTVDSRNTAEILEGHLLQLSAWQVTAAAGSTVGSNDTGISEIIAARQRRRRWVRWRRVRPKILAVARFQWMLSRIRRLEDLRSVLDRRVAIDELVVREIAAHLGLLPLLPPHQPSQRIMLIDLDLQPAGHEERRRRS